MAQSVKCVNCGFLSARGQDTGEFVEISLTQRQHAHIPYGKPICFVMSFSLLSEVDELSRNNSTTVDSRGHPAAEAKRDASSAVRDVVTRNRDCPSFCAWQQGFSPKEHKEMMLESELRKMQQELREKDIAREEQHRRDSERQREKDLEWRAEQERKTEERWAEQEQKVEARWKSENKLQKYSLIIVGIIGTIILAVAQIVGSLIQAGWFNSNAK